MFPHRGKAPKLPALRKSEYIKRDDPHRNWRRSRPWAKISNSANADVKWRRTVEKNAKKIYDMKLICSPPFTDSEGSECDDGKTCLCGKPPSAAPKHAWKWTSAAKFKYHTMLIMCDSRDPSLWSMDTFDDHAAYGTLEVIQNAVLDFEHTLEVRDRWTICEALGFFMPSDYGAKRLNTLSDRAYVQQTILLLGRMFLEMLAHAHEKNALTSYQCSIPNLDIIAALFLQLPSLFNLPSKPPGSEPFQHWRRDVQKPAWNPNLFQNYIYAYTLKFSIPLRGPKNLDQITSGCDPDVNLPEQVTESEDLDPFGFLPALDKYRRDWGWRLKRMSPREDKESLLWEEIGRDWLDITTWSPEAKKKASNDGKDPVKAWGLLPGLEKGRVLSRKEFPFAGTYEI